MYDLLWLLTHHQYHQRRSKIGIMESIQGHDSFFLFISLSWKPYMVRTTTCRVPRMFRNTSIRSHNSVDCFRNDMLSPSYVGFVIDSGFLLIGLLEVWLMISWNRWTNLGVLTKSDSLECLFIIATIRQSRQKTPICYWHWTWRTRPFARR